MALMTTNLLTLIGSADAAARNAHGRSNCCGNKTIRMLAGRHLLKEGKAVRLSGIQTTCGFFGRGWRGEGRYGLETVLGSGEIKAWRLRKCLMLVWNNQLLFLAVGFGYEFKQYPTCFSISAMWKRSHNPNVSLLGITTKGNGFRSDITHSPSEHTDNIKHCNDDPTAGRPNLLSSRPTSICFIPWSAHRSSWYFLILCPSTIMRRRLEFSPWPQTEQELHVGFVKCKVKGSSSAC